MYRKWNFFKKTELERVSGTNGTKYSRTDQVEFM